MPGWIVRAVKGSSRRNAMHVPMLRVCVGVIYSPALFSFGHPVERLGLRGEAWYARELYSFRPHRRCHPCSDSDGGLYGSPLPHEESTPLQQNKLTGPPITRKPLSAEQHHSSPRNLSYLSLASVARGPASASKLSTGRLLVWAKSIRSNPRS